MIQTILTHSDIQHAVDRLLIALGHHCHDGVLFSVYPVPRGGVPVWYAIKGALANYSVTHGVTFLVTDDPAEADIFIDDLIDSGKTRTRYIERATRASAKFFALYDKKADKLEGQWLVFPWEATVEHSSNDIFTRLIQFAGEDPLRQGLRETPERMARAWKEWTSGYHDEPFGILKTFEDGAEHYDEMIHVANIPFYSHCEHHMTPFFGTVSFAYIPNARIVGLSKFGRLVECFARRLQVQERLTTQIIDHFCDFITTKGAGITVRARHLCMESRGIRHAGCVTTTNRFIGALKDVPSARMEYLHLTK